MNVRIGCDLDGVLGDIVAQILRFAHELYGVTIEPDAIKSEQAEAALGLTAEELALLFSRREFFLEMPALSGAAAALTRAASEGAEIFIVTDRFWYPELHRDTVDWLQAHTMPFKEVVFARKTEKQKVSLDLGLRVFIEDQASNAALLAEVVPVLLLDKPYNRDFLIRPGIERVQGLDEAIDRVLAVGASKQSDVAHSR